MPPLNPRPYEAGSALAEHVEDVTGDTAEAYDLTAAVPVIVTDPVRVEDQSPRYLTTDQVPVTAVASRIVSALRSRSTVTISPVGGDVYIGGESVTLGTGFLIREGGGFSLEASCAVYAVTSGAGVVVHILTQHRDG